MISWEDFEKVGLIIGTITRAEDFPEAKKPAYKLWIDFGEFGRQTGFVCYRLSAKADSQFHIRSPDYGLCSEWRRNSFGTA